MMKRQQGRARPCATQSNISVYICGGTNVTMQKGVHSVTVKPYAHLANFGVSHIKSNSSVAL